MQGPYSLVARKNTRKTPARLTGAALVQVPRIRETWKRIRVTLIQKDIIIIIVDVARSTHAVSCPSSSRRSAVRDITQTSGSENSSPEH